MKARPPGLGTVGPDAPLVHVHIPKTAGSTFNAILRHRVSAAQIYEHPSYFNDSGAGGQALRAAAGSRSVILGHLDLRCRHSLPPEALYVSFLRDPVARVVSGYHNILRDPSNPAHDRVRGMDLLEYVTSGVVRDVDNGQVRRLAGVGMELPFGALGGEHLRLARANIKGSRYYIGITERFDESLILLQDMLGTNPLHYVPVNSRRRGLRPPRLQALELERIRSFNKLDLELYAVESRLLAKGLEQTEDLDRRLRRFRQGQPVFRIATLPSRLLRRAKNRILKPLR